MSIDHYFDRSLDRADRAVMHIGDARRQLWFSVAILGLCAMLAAFHAPTISASRNAKFEVGGMSVHQPCIMRWKDAPQNNFPPLQASAEG
jgi:queuine/archaeosine tRNA-ribosyltransferase